MQKTRWILLALTIVMLSVASCSDDPARPPEQPRIPSVFLVEADGSGDVATIQDAINAAADGDTILLANGTFKGDGNRDIDYTGKRILVRSRSGDPDSCIIDAEGTPSDYHRGFHFHTGEGPESVLEGVTIINGFGLGGGGGVLCDNASPRLVNLVLRRHEFGGGVYCRLASPIVQRCLFEENLDGGLQIWSSNPIVRECVFLRNLEGAIGCFVSSATIESCVFIENEDDIAGAIHVGAEADDGGFVSIRGCAFIDNRSSSDGGAVLFADTPGELLNCLIVNNTAGRMGGAVHATLKTVLRISNTTIVENTAPTGSGLYVGSGAKVMIDNAIIAFGVAGAAVECDTSTVVFGPVEATVECSDIYGNEGGDWITCLQGLEGQDGNISADPLFCSLANGDLHLKPGSPCFQTYCGLMGALPVGCPGPLPVFSPVP